MKKLSETILLAGVFLIVCLSGAACRDGKEKPTPPPPVKVVVIEVAAGHDNGGREYSGTVSSSESTTVSFSVPGTITDLYAKEGQKVSKGQLLGKVRNGEYLNAYNIAKAELAQAQDGYDRLKKLHDANALPEVKWVEMEQKLTQAQNMVEIAERTLKDAELHSPATGTVSRKMADVGQTVVPVEPIYEIVSTGNLSLDIQVSENEISGFNTGEEGIVSIKAAGLPEIKGKVSQKSVVADPLTRSFTVKIDLSETGGKVLPGMIGNVRFSQNRLDSTAPQILLPSRAVLLNEDSRIFVWVVSDSVARQRFVVADEMAENGVIIREGLKLGDKVIVAGMQKVANGTKVVYE